MRFLGRAGERHRHDFGDRIFSRGGQHFAAVHAGRERGVESLGVAFLVAGGGVGGPPPLPVEITNTQSELPPALLPGVEKVWLPLLDTVWAEPTGLPETGSYHWAVPLPASCDMLTVRLRDDGV